MVELTKKGKIEDAVKFQEVIDNGPGEVEIAKVEEKKPVIEPAPEPAPKKMPLERPEAAVKPGNGRIAAIVKPAKTTVKDNIYLRGGFHNSKNKFEIDKKGHVVLIGSTVTAMGPYKNMVVDLLKKRFPATDFTFTHAGVTSTCSTFGAFRLKQDVLEKGPVDLVFLEFSVNDSSQDANHAARECIRGAEGIVRQVREHNPKADIVASHFVNGQFFRQMKSNKPSEQIVAHNKVYEHYGISVIDICKEAFEKIENGSLDSTAYKGAMPQEKGHEFNQQMTEKFINLAWAGKEEVRNHYMPKILDGNSYINGRYLDRGSVKMKGFENSVPDWASIGGKQRKQFNNYNCFHTTAGGSEISFDFEGTAIGAFILVGPDSGKIEVSIDGSSFKALEVSSKWTATMHYPKAVIFDADLKPGSHKLILRAKSEGGNSAVRILHFLAN